MIDRLTSRKNDLFSEPNNSIIDSERETKKEDQD